MASLYQTTKNARRFIIYALVAAVAIVAVDSGLKFLNSSFNPVFYPDVSLYQQRGEFDDVEVPALPLSSIAIDSQSNPLFTTNGNFPSHPDIAFVYTLQSPSLKLDSEENALRTASTLGFPGSYTNFGSNNYMWENPSKTRTLRSNIESQSWELRTQYFLDPQALLPKTLLPNAGDYESKAKRILASAGFTDQGLQNGIVTAIYAKLGNDALFTNPINQNNADYAFVSVFRSLPLARLKPNNQMPALPDDYQLPPEFDGKIFSADPRYGSVTMVLGDGASNSTTDVYEMDFTNLTYNYNALIREIYSPEEAWTEVRSGEGKLRLIKPQTADYFADSSVLKVEEFSLDAAATELGYFEPSEWNSNSNRFVYPIYIFRGTAELENGLVADFVFYMEAVKEQSLV